MGIERRLERLQVHYYIRAVLVPSVLDSYLDSIEGGDNGGHRTRLERLSASRMTPWVHLRHV
jgi:hypothetical protein